MILLIDNYDSFTYNLYQLLSECGADVKVIRNDAINLIEIEAMNPEAIVISPGPGTPEDAGICIEAVLHFAPKIPILGICLGHQAIAKAFGAVVRRAEHILHGKSSHVFHRRKGLFDKMPLPFSAGRYHSLLVEKSSLPTDLIIEAESGLGEIMALRHKKFPCFGLQFHPESILTPDGKTLILNFLQQEVYPCSRK